MVQRWRSFLSLSLLLVSIGFLSISYSLHAYPAAWTDSFWSSWLHLFPQQRAGQLIPAWAGGFFMLGSLLMLGSTVLLIWGRRWRKGLFLAILLALILGALLASAALTEALGAAASGGHTALQITTAKPFSPLGQTLAQIFHSLRPF